MTDYQNLRPENQSTGDVTVSDTAMRMEGEANPRRGMLGPEGAQEGQPGRLVTPS